MVPLLRQYLKHLSRWHIFSPPLYHLTNYTDGIYSCNISFQVVTCDVCKSTLVKRPVSAHTKESPTLELYVIATSNRLYVKSRAWNHIASLTSKWHPSIAQELKYIWSKMIISCEIGLEWDFTRLWGRLNKMHDSCIPYHETSKLLTAEASMML